MCRRLGTLCLLHLHRWCNQEEHLFLVSNFRRVLNFVLFLLDDSPACEFYVPTFRNTLFHLHRCWKQEEYNNSTFILDFKLPPNSGCCCISFLVIPRRLNLMCRRFGTLLHLHRCCKQEEYNNSTFILDFKLSQNSGCCCISFLVIPRRLNLMCRRFGTLCSIFIGVVSRKNTTILHLFPLSPVTGFVWISEPTAVSLWCGQVQLDHLFLSLTVKWRLKFRVPGRRGCLSAQISLYCFHLYRVRNWNDGKGVICCYRGAPLVVPPV